jgi:hypothetical protein
VTGDSVEYDQDAFVGKATAIKLGPFGHVLRDGTAFDTERAQEPTKQFRGPTGALIGMEVHVELPAAPDTATTGTAKALPRAVNSCLTCSTSSAHRQQGRATLPGLRRHRPRGPHAAEVQRLFNRPWACTTAESLLTTNN